MSITRRTAMAALLLAIPFGASASGPEVILYKDPQCGCCTAYAEYLKINGFTVEVRPTTDLAEISRKAGVPDQYQGCHAAFVEGYVIHGHVPLEAVQKLLAERPAIAGLALPGMPAGSPGMGGDKVEPFVIYAMTKDGSAPTIFMID